MSERELDSQADRILRHLRRGDSITPLGALKRYGCLRLGARIWDLRSAGWVIAREWEKGGNNKRWAKYRLARKRRRRA
jgi:hypothetical protein